ncbi:hypothetical protein RHECNPAF_2190072 [Rhizobium etli CNPAF512]|nr:hypothetical protein RHECNPAF_2190072 [Rhizobium etli CNPAF512]
MTRLANVYGHRSTAAAVGRRSIPPLHQDAPLIAYGWRASLNIYSNVIYLYKTCLEIY